MIGFFKVISISAPHIYHSALPLSPRESIVHKLYRLYLRPLVRVVRGLPISWELSVATVMHTATVGRAAWSWCSRFIAVALRETIEILDSATLERLHTFTCSSGRTRWLSLSPDSRSMTQFSHYGLTTWDLQTGGRISASPSTSNPSFLQYFSSAYSTDGKIVGVAYKDRDHPDIEFISTYNYLSGTHIYSHRVLEGRIVPSIWTHGDFLRFVTVKRGSITIWEVGFTSEHTLAEVESLPAPDDDIDPEKSLFLPTRTRLAFILRETVLVWDARDSKFLLTFVSGNELMGFSFSSDGRFFAYRTYGREIHLWKESPTGYVLHRKIASDIGGSLFSEPHLSPDGESIITSNDSATQLWRTTDPTNSLSTIPAQLDDPPDFILEFSPDRSLAAVTRLGDITATIIDLKSGDPRLIIDTGMKIRGLGVTGNMVFAVGDEKVIAWSLPAGDCVLDARANIHDSVRTIVFDCPAPPLGRLQSASISPNFDYFATTLGPNKGLGLFDISTGKYLVGTTPGDMYTPWFTRDGLEVWPSRYYPRAGWKITKHETSEVIGLEPLEWNAYPSGGHPWESAHGHNVTDDGWILDSRNKRVMWLPHRWRIDERRRIWDARFLGLLDPELPEPVILEFDE